MLPIANGQKAIENRLTIMENKLTTMENGQKNLELGQSGIKGDIRTLDGKIEGLTCIIHEDFGKSSKALARSSSSDLAEKQSVF